MPHSVPKPKSLNDNETIVLFPSLGHLEPDGRTWRIDVHGEVFSQRRISFGQRILLKLLQRAMKVPREALDTEIFKRRIDRFLATDGRGKKIAVRIGSDVHLLPKKSRGNGHFQATLRLSEGELQELQREGISNAEWLRLEVYQTGNDEVSAQGQVHLLPSEGVSVISDIDDTLKHTHVHSRQALLANTFLKEYEPVPGMANLFRQWEREGAAFHYVSSSPWQLYRHLAAHFEEERFPAGSFHLRSFRLRDHLLRRILLMRRSGKAAIIKNILQTFPGRRFLLVGDSGEADPEIYAALARKFPQQVSRVLIREVDGPKNTLHRFMKAFRGIPGVIATTFRDPAEIHEAVTDL